MRYKRLQFLFWGAHCRTAALVLLAVVLALPACSNRGSKVYNDGEAYSVQRVSYGTVVAVDNVRVEKGGSGTGAILGGIAGAAVGSFFGGGSGKILTVLGGAAAGALGGSAIEGEAKSYNALQITTELEDGSIVVIVQKDDEYFAPGDKVRIISTGDDTARVQHI